MLVVPPRCRPEIVPSWIERDRLRSSSAAQRVVRHHFDVLLQKCDRAVTHREQTAARMMALEASPAPKCADLSTAGAIVRPLLLRTRDVEIHRQAGAVDRAVRAKPDHRRAAREVGVVPK